MSRGYGKYRRGNYHASFQFDNLFKENKNKPSAARSTGVIGKWGVTSFTSIRTINGLPVEAEKAPAAVPEVDHSVPRPKKFFKSRNADPPDLPAAIYTEKTEITYGTPSKRTRTISSSSSEKSYTKTTTTKKFFTSRNSSAEKVLSLNVNNSKRDDSKPPIVLRICRGKSQLLSDSDESESTPTPSSTPTTSTSPRASRDSSQRSPGNVRITRSARRSMQQDGGLSPVPADTPAESFSIFTSPKMDYDLSPQYIPAEQYELARKALYDNLLKADSPKDGLDVKVDEEKVFGDFELNETRVENNNDVESEGSKIEEPVLDNTDPSLDSFGEPPLLLKESCNEPMKVSEQPPKKLTLEEDWSSSDSDSDSVAPELDSKVKESDKPSFPIDEHKEEILEKILEAPAENSNSVKLVISKKKGSIFKSRALVTDDAKKRRAVYRHKWCDDRESAQKPSETTNNNKAGGSCYDEYGFNDDPLMRISGSNDDSDSAVTSVKCTKGDKGYYTVVRNVKKAHQIQEIGEFQEFNDDVEYILDALKDNNPISTRCLSAITLASKCMVPAFRMHVRAHGTVAKFFKALHDATKDQSLGLCTATVMFVLSQDRLNMDLDRDCLELMLNLLESDVSYQQALDVCGLSSAQLEKNKQKVRELCAEIQSQGHAKHLNLDNITVGQLAMETLLSLTSKRAGEWFKEELRELGGIEHIVKTICECCRQVSDYVVTWTDALLDKLRKIDRCLRVLENVTHNNEENQTYLLKYNNGIMLDTLVKLYRLCDSEIPLYPITDITDKESAGTIIREALLVTLKVLINLTHHFNKESMGSTLIGTRPGIIESSLHLLLQVPHYIPDQKKFELGVLVLMLLINLIQDHETNKKLLIDAKAPADYESVFSCDKSAVEGLIAQFYQWEEYARVAEKRTDAILDGEKDGESDNTQQKSNEEFIEETVAKLLQKAGTHMEFTFLASYIVMLLGFLMMDNGGYQKIVRQFIRGDDFSSMVELLKKFFNFMSLTASAGASNVCAIKTTEKVINFLEDCDKPASALDTSGLSDTGLSMDLSYSLTD